MNEWLILVVVIVVALIAAIVMVMLQWVGWKGIIGGFSCGGIVGMIIWFVNKSLTALLIAMAVGIVLGIASHLIVRLAVGRG